MHRLGLFALVAAVVGVPALATARPITAGVGLGLTQTKADADAGAESSHTLELFGRLGLTSRLSAQGELQRISSDDSYLELRTATALLVVDLTTPRQIAPILLVGIGLDHASTEYGGSSDGHHVEGGFGLEYRASGGLTIGADLRMGGRWIDSSKDMILPLAIERDVTAIYPAPGTLSAGEYRAARLYAAVRF